MTKSTQAERRRQQDKEHKVAARQQETPEEASERKKANREQSQKKLDDLTPDERAQMRRDRALSQRISRSKKSGDFVPEFDDPESWDAHLRKIASDFRRAIFGAWAACACCDAYRPKNKMRVARAADFELHCLSARADGEQLLLCSACYNFKPTGKSRNCDVCCGRKPGETCYHDRPKCPLNRTNLAQPEPIPAGEDLSDLNYMELQCVRLAVPFQTVITLPQGQEGAIGQVIHMPSDPVLNIARLLPMLPDSNNVFVRQAKPSGTHTKFWQLRPEKVFRMIRFLERNSHQYENISVRDQEAVTKAFAEFDELSKKRAAEHQDDFGAAEIQPESSSSASANSRADTAQSPNIRDESDSDSDDYECLLSEATVLDLDAATQHVIEESAKQASHDSSFAAKDLPADAEQRTLPTASGTPLRAKDTYVEEACYPHIFWKGRGGLKDPDREMPLKTSEYVQARILKASGEFAADRSYPFRALIIQLQDKVAKAVQFCRRQVAPGTKASPGAVDKLTRSEVIALMDRTEEAVPTSSIMGELYKIIGQTIRGSSMYWKSAHAHLKTMMSSLGPPQLFLTFSANDMRWWDVFHAIDPKRFATKEAVEALTRRQRINLINRHPAVVAEHFCNRARALVNVLKADDKLLGGPVVDYFFRIEFQARGSPHLHGCVWIAGVPDPNDQPEEYLRWVDHVVSAELPDGELDPKLRKLVETHQMHAHTFTCQCKPDEGTKTGRNRRAGMRARAQERELHAGLDECGEDSDSDDDDDAENGVEVNEVESEDIARIRRQEERLNEQADEALKRAAQLPEGIREKIFGYVKRIHLSSDIDTRRRRFFAQLAERRKCRFGFPQPLSDRTRFRTSAETKYTVRGDRDIILRRRKEEDRRVNNYNPFLLQLWESNMDIQPISDPYAAAAYMMAYITKNEKSERDVVREALNALPPDRRSLDDILLRMANAILSGRKVSKQEAMMLIIGEPLYFTSRSTLFVPAFTSEKRRRVTLRRSVLEQSRDANSTDVWARGVDDYYLGRPRDEPGAAPFWSNMTLYQFSAWCEQCPYANSFSGVDSDVPGENQEPEDSSDLRNDAGSLDYVQQGPYQLPPGVSPSPAWLAGECTGPPLVNDELGKRRLPRFVVSLPGGYRRAWRIRTKPKCIAAPGSNNGDSSVTKYAALAMNVPHYDVWADVLGVPRGVAVDDLVLDEALVRHRLVIEQAKGFVTMQHRTRLESVIRALERRSAVDLRTFIPPDPDAGAADAPRIEPSKDTLRILDESLGTAAGPAPSAKAAAGAHTCERPPPQIGTGEDSPDYIYDHKLNREQRRAADVLIRYLDRLDKYEEAAREWQRACGARLWNEPEPPKPVKPPAPRIFVTGPGGTGKSYLIGWMVKKVQQWCWERKLDRPSQCYGVLVCAPTGVAAYNIRGETVHSVFHLKPELNGFAEQRRLGKEELESMKNFLRNLVLVIIDEVSMLSGRNLSAVHARLSEILGLSADLAKTSDRFFGDVMIAAFGDFAQLRPVGGRFVFEDALCLQPLPGLHLWKSLFYPIHLTISERQKNPRFAAMLNRIRLGRVANRDLRDLSSRSLDEVLNPRYRDVLEEYESPEWRAALRLFSRNKDADEYNKKMYHYTARDSGQPLYYVQSTDVAMNGAVLTSEELKSKVPEDHNRTGGLKHVLMLTVGGEVMLRRNMDVGNGLYNGATGTIARIDWDGEPPQPNAATARRPGGPLEVATARLPKAVWVHFHDRDVGRTGESEIINGRRAVPIRPMNAEFPVGEGTRSRVRVQRTQLPLIESFAITIHKSQGLTLPKVVLDIGGDKIFTAALAYVALSRVRNLEDFIIVAFDPATFYMAPEVIAEYERLSRLPGPSELNNWGADLIPGQCSAVPTTPELFAKADAEEDGLTGCAWCCEADDAGSDMVQCEECGDWLHLSCMKPHCAASPDEATKAPKTGTVRCPRCAAAHQQKKKPGAAKRRRDAHSAGKDAKRQRTDVRGEGNGPRREPPPAGKGAKRSRGKLPQKPQAPGNPGTPPTQQSFDSCFFRNRGTWSCHIDSLVEVTARCAMHATLGAAAFPGQPPFSRQGMQSDEALRSLLALRYDVEIPSQARDQMREQWWKNAWLARCNRPLPPLGSDERLVSIGTWLRWFSGENGPDFLRTTVEFTGNCTACHNTCSLRESRACFEPNPADNAANAQAADECMLAGDAWKLLRDAALSLQQPRPADYGSTVPVCDCGSDSDWEWFQGEIVSTPPVLFVDIGEQFDNISVYHLQDLSGHLSVSTLSLPVTGNHTVDYTLSGFIVHQPGHYTAYFRDGAGVWCHYDDFSGINVLQSAPDFEHPDRTACVLAYARTSSPPPPPPAAAVANAIVPSPEQGFVWKDNSCSIDSLVEALAHALRCFTADSGLQLTLGSTPLEQLLQLRLRNAPVAEQQRGVASVWSSTSPATFKQYRSVYHWGDDMLARNELPRWLLSTVRHDGCCTEPDCGRRVERMRQGLWLVAKNSERSSWSARVQSALAAKMLGGTVSASADTISAELGACSGHQYSWSKRFERSADVLFIQTFDFPADGVDCLPIRVQLDEGSGIGTAYSLAACIIFRPGRHYVTAVRRDGDWFLYDGLPPQCGRWERLQSSRLESGDVISAVVYVKVSHQAQGQSRKECTTHVTRAVGY